MLRGHGRCGGCQAVLYKLKNKVLDRRCDSCSAPLSEYNHIAYYCSLCERFACKQCTNVSRVSTVLAAPSPRPQLPCDGCQGVLVPFEITRASVNRHCHSCGAAFEYRGELAYHCDSCTRIMCKLCTWDLRSGARRRAGLRRWSSPVCGIRRGCLISRAGTAESEVRTTEQQPVDTAGADEHERAQMAHKRPRLSPAAGAAESEVRTTVQQPVDTASADEHERAQMADEHERLTPAAGAAESEVRTTVQQPVDTASADERERAQTAEKHERAQIRDALEIYREAQAARGVKVKKVRLGDNGCGKTEQHGIPTRQSMLDRWLNSDRKAAKRQSTQLASLIFAPGQDAEDAHPLQDPELLAAADECAQLSIRFENLRKDLRRKIANGLRARGAGKATTSSGTTTRPTGSR